MMAFKRCGISMYNRPPHSAQTDFLTENCKAGRCLRVRHLLRYEGLARQRL